jgi:hypothetical protein
MLRLLTASDWLTFTLDPQPPTDETVPVRPATSDWSDIHSGHPQPQTDWTVAVDTSSLRLIVLCLWTPYSLRLIRQCQWTPYNLRLIRHSQWTPYTFRLIRYSQWKPPILGLIRQSQWTPHNLRLIIRPGRHYNVWLIRHSQWIPYNFRLIRQSHWTPYNLRLISSIGHPTTSDWSDSPTVHFITWGWSDNHIGHPQPQTVPMDTPSFSPCTMNNTIFMFKLDSTRRSWAK